MLMYTSCGWFFDELSGLETVQVIHYAGRALQLAEQSCGAGSEAQFLERLAKAKSNLPEHGDGARIYEKWVKPAYVDIERLAGHYAISSLFENYGDKTQIYCYDVERDNYSQEAEGKMRLGYGSRSSAFGNHARERSKWISPCCILETTTSPRASARTT